MFDLKCKRQNCVHNKNCNCTAKDVDVRKDTTCKTFAPSNEAEVGEVEKIGQPPVRKDINVGCKAECIFNTNCICTANGITVQTCGEGDARKDPLCCTFEPK